MAIVDVRYPGQTPIMNAAAASADQTSDIVEMGKCTHATFQVIWSGIDDTDGTVKLQVSEDQTNWVYKADSAGSAVTLTIGSAADTGSISLNGVVTEKYYRAVYTKNSNTTGTVTVKVGGKVFA